MLGALRYGKQENVMAPRQLSNKALDNCLFNVGLGKGPHGVGERSARRDRVEMVIRARHGCVLEQTFHLKKRALSL